MVPRTLSGEPPRPPLSYKQALAWLYGLQRFGIKLGLENIQRLLAELSRKGDLQIAHGGLFATGRIRPIGGEAAAPCLSRSLRLRFTM